MEDTMSTRIKEEIEQTLALLEETAEIRPEPFFADRVMNKIIHGKTATKSVVMPLFLRPAFIAVFMVFNVASIIYASTQPISTQQQSIEILAEEYNTTISWMEED